MELNQNAINNAEEETEPLLRSDLENRPMAPTSHSPRETQTAGYRPVVGYIQVANRTYGTALNTSPSLIRSLESPSLYNAQPREVAPPQSPRRFLFGRQNEQVQNNFSRSVEERDLFRPPPGQNYD